MINEKEIKEGIDIVNVRQNCVNLLVEIGAELKFAEALCDKEQKLNKAQYAGTVQAGLEQVKQTL